MADFMVVLFLTIFGALTLMIGGFMLFAGTDDPLDKGENPYDPMAILTGRTAQPVAAQTVASTPQRDVARLAA